MPSRGSSGRSAPRGRLDAAVAFARGAAMLGDAVASMPAFFVAQLPVMLATRSGDFSIWLARRLWAPAGLRIGGVELEVTQLAPLPDGPALYASNHESLLDAWALFVAIPRSLRFAAKRELFAIPVFGWYLRLAKFVEVDRRNHARAVASLKRAGEIVRAGVSIVVFPEGTRSPTGSVLAFKKGPFALAQEAAVPVVPVAIAGASRVVRKGRVECRPGVVRVAIGAAVRPADYPDRDALLREVRRRIVELHRRIGGAGDGAAHSRPDGSPAAANDVR